MKVGEARHIYSAQLKAYNIEKCKLGKQRQELKEKIKRTENGAIIYANEAATLELAYQAVKEKQNEYQEYMNRLMEQWDAKFNEIASKENAKAEKEAFDELGKIMEVVRRMTKGDTVPADDEKKVMEYDKDIYQMAKSAQMLARMHRKGEKHDSLWKEEEESEREDPMNAADEQEAFADGPEVISVEDTIDV